MRRFALMIAAFGMPCTSRGLAAYCGQPDPTCAGVAQDTTALQEFRKSGPKCSHTGADTWGQARGEGAQACRRAMLQVLWAYNRMDFMLHLLAVRLRCVVAHHYITEIAYAD